MDSVPPCLPCHEGAGPQADPARRTYKRWVATYTMWPPSGDRATKWRPVLENRSPIGKGIGNRASLSDGADAGLSIHATEAAIAATATATRIESGAPDL